MKKGKNNKVEIEEEIEEEIVEDNSNVDNYKHSSSGNGIVYAILACIIMLLILIVFIILIVKSEDTTPTDSEETENLVAENIELKHTESTDVASTGVYITDVSEVVEEVMPSIVSITSKTVISSGNYGPSRGRNYVSVGAGSGVIVYEDDNNLYVLTNYHVVEDSSELSVKFINDKSYDAKVKGVSERKDIAIVSISKKDMDSDTLKQIKIATLGSSDDLKVGNGIIAIGNALGYGQSVTTGVVSAVNREVSTDDYTQDMIQIDAAINGGNSGGALLNSKGEVVGINSIKYSSSAYSTSASIEGMGFAIPISDVESIIKQLITGKDDDSGVLLGIEGVMTSSSQLSRYDLPDGLYVTVITSGGNAEKSDLEIGNIITKVEGTKVTSIETVRKALSKKNKGDKITLTVKYASGNSYKEKDITVTLSK